MALDLRWCASEKERTSTWMSLCLCLYLSLCFCVYVGNEHRPFTSLSLPSFPAPKEYSDHLSTYPTNAVASLLSFFSSAFLFPPNRVINVDLSTFPATVTASLLVDFFSQLPVPLCARLAGAFLKVCVCICIHS